MLKNPVQKLLSRSNLARLDKTSRAALALSTEIEALSDAALKERFYILETQPEKNLAEALALVREAASRTLGLKAYGVQLMGAVALFQGVIVEMKTGEGKTLTIALAASIAAMDKIGVHVATANPYLAARDAETMRPLYEFLGLSVGVTLPGQSVTEKQAAYNSDITYGVHSEIGFDYLRDNLVLDLDQRVQRGLSFVIVDEADSILIDEARTPLIISQPAEGDASIYHLADRVVRSLKKGADYSVDEKTHQALLTEAGLDKVEALLMQAGILAHTGALYEPGNLHLMRYLTASMKAHSLYKRDRDYIVREGEVLIIDDSTGRILDGRQWQEGLHQAIEIKEGVAVKPETETAAEITYQSLFRLYDRLSGLTGTALTSAEEFESMYGLAVVPIPTHRPVIRQDLPDQLFRTKADKFNAIAADIKVRVAKGQPILIGTASVKESEELSGWLNRAGIAHRVLNARQNAQEAEIIADAGLPGAVTVATNMAGRGTDIVLGGHTDKDATWQVQHAVVLAAGGLHVVGTTRNESRRVDDQLRGRAGRQGDPGSSQFYLCLEDDLLRIFGSDRLRQLFDLAGVEHEALSGGMFDKAVNKAQEKVEARNFDSRKNLAKFDGVMSDQREAVYRLRREILDGSMPVGYCLELIEEAALALTEAYLPGEFHEAWDIKGLKVALENELGPNLNVIKWMLMYEKDELEKDELITNVVDGCLAYYREHREAEEGLSVRERQILLSILDQLWRSHLTHLDGLREGINLRSYANIDPVVAFREDAYEAFLSLRKALVGYAASALTFAFRAPAATPDAAIIEVRDPVEGEAGVANGAVDAAEPPYRLIRRNQPCPCGSGQRFKRCHGKLP